MRFENITREVECDAFIGQNKRTYLFRLRTVTFLFSLYFICLILLDMSIHVEPLSTEPGR